MLILVLVVGDTVFGGKRWLWFFQPSEISKICVIMFIAELFGSDDDTVGFISKKWRRGFRGFLVFSLVLGVPSLLILAEPDLGTTLTLAPAALMMIYAAKIW
jgi:cell division protein FtsW (lipid II flippase)